MLIDIYGKKNAKIETKPSLKYLKITLIAFGLLSIVITYIEWSHIYQFLVLFAEIEAIMSLLNKFSPKYLLFNR